MQSITSISALLFENIDETYVNEKRSRNSYAKRFKDISTGNEYKTILKYKHLNHIFYSTLIDREKSCNKRYKIIPKKSLYLRIKN